MATFPIHLGEPRPDSRVLTGQHMLVLRRGRRVVRASGGRHQEGRERGAMTRALVIGAGIAGPVTGMALGKADIEAAVFHAYPLMPEDVGSFLTVATNGLDALRAIGADQTVLATGFPTACNLMVSGTGKRLGTVSNGGALRDGTVAHTVKRARLNRALHQEASRRASPSSTRSGSRPPS